MAQAPDNYEAMLQAEMAQIAKEHPELSQSSTATPAAPAPTAAPAPQQHTDRVAPGGIAGQITGNKQAPIFRLEDLPNSFMRGIELAYNNTKDSFAQSVGAANDAAAQLVDNTVGAGLEALYRNVGLTSAADKVAATRADHVEAAKLPVERRSEKAGGTPALFKATTAPVAPGSDAVVNQLFESVTQGVTGAIAGGYMLRGVGASGAALKYGGAALGDFLAFAGHDPNAANVLEQAPFIGPAFSLLATNPDDPELVGRLKTAATGVLSEAALSSVIKTAKYVHEARKGNIEGALKAADELEAAHKPPEEPAGAPQPAPSAEHPAAPETPPRAPEARPAASAEVAPKASPEAAPLVRSTEEDAKAILNDYGSAMAHLDDPEFSARLNAIPPTGGPISLAKYTNPDSVKALVASVVDHYSDFEGLADAARGPVMSHKQLIKDGEALAKRFIEDAGGNLNVFKANMADIARDVSRLPQTIQAYRAIAQNSAYELKAAAEAFSTARTPENTQRLLTAIESSATINAYTESFRPASGRILNLHRIVNRDSASIQKVLADLKDIDVIQRLDPTGTADSVLDALGKHADAIASTDGSIRQVRATTRPSFNRAVQNAAVQLYRDSVLSSFTTTERNVISAFGMIAQDHLNNALVGSLRAATGGDRELLQQTGDAIIGNAMQIPEATKWALEALKKGHSVIDPVRSSNGLYGVDALHPENFGATGAWATALNSVRAALSPVRRVNAAADEFVSRIGAVGKLRAEGLRRGREQGLDGQELLGFTKQYIAESFDAEGGLADGWRGMNMDRIKAEIVDAGNKKGLTGKELEAFVDSGVQAAGERLGALGFTNRIKFAEQPGELTSAVEAALNKAPILKVITQTPFIRGPGNILRTAIEDTPGLGLLTKRVRRELSGDLGKTVQMQRLGQWGIASGVYFSAFMAGYTGDITGPSGINSERELKKDLNILPTAASPDGGKTMVGFANLDPWSTQIGLGVALGQAARRIHDRFGDTEEAANHMQILMDEGNKAFVQSFAQLLDKGFFTGIQNWLEFMSSIGSGNPGQHSKQQARFASGYAPLFVPYSSLLNRVNTDETLRQPNDFVQMLEAKIPGLSQNVDPERDLLGRPLQRTQDWFNRLANPLSSSLTKSDPALEEMLQLVERGKATFNDPNHTFKGVDMRAMKAADGKLSVYSKMQELAATLPDDTGKTMPQQLADLVASDLYRNQLSDGDEQVAGTRAQALAYTRNAGFTNAINQMLDPNSSVFEPEFAKALGVALDHKADVMSAEEPISKRKPLKDPALNKLLNRQGSARGSKIVAEITNPQSQP